MGMRMIPAKPGALKNGKGDLGRLTRQNGVLWLAVSLGRTDQAVPMKGGFLIEMVSDPNAELFPLADTDQRARAGLIIAISSAFSRSKGQPGTAGCKDFTRSQLDRSRKPGTGRRQGRG